MYSKARRVIRLILAAAIACILLGGCGGSGDSGNSGTGSLSGSGK